MTSTPAPPARSLPLNLLLAATTLLSAWLLFQVQPMVAKRILPWFGGGAAIWTTTMLFFQAALFVGYLYAHLVAKSLPARTQVRLHCALLALAAALVTVIGVVPPDAWQPAGTGRPALRILATLAGCVGLPYLVLAATAPLVQVWFSRANPGRSPYRLYAISNIGSLAALLSYPLLLEPNIGVLRQGAAWSALFIVFAIACGISGVMSLHSQRDAFDDLELPTREPQSLSPRSDEAPTRLRYAFWISLPACASVLLLAITAYICQNIAPIPLLWIMPMVAYLISFILTFDSDRWYDRRFWMPLAAMLSFAAVYTWHKEVTPDIPYLVGLHLALLFAACMVCHGELARLRPPSERLTTYYLCIAGGGALGGIFTGLVAPLLFVDHYELHLSLLAAWLLALGVLVTDRTSPFYDGGKGNAYKGLLAMAVLAVAFAVSLGVHVRERRDDAIEMSRSFYGPLKLMEKIATGTDLPYLELTNGHIAHGGQFYEEINRRVPMWYYPPESGIGGAMTKLKATPPRRVGVVGLGTGTLAAYAEQGDVFKFYDINPQVIDIAERQFSYLKDARERGAEVVTIEGDARRSLEQGPPQEFDVLVLDAFNGDAIPVHLLTMEAFDEYLRHLTPDGIIAVHVSNSYLSLESVVQAAVDRYKLDVSLVQTFANTSPGAGGSAWVLLHREPGYFAQHDFGGPLERDGQPFTPVPWTDDFSNVVEILKW